ncbi:hypothetical protein Tco_0501666 [Tanacetum coccineum]
MVVRVLFLNHMIALDGVLFLNDIITYADIPMGLLRLLLLLRMKESSQLKTVLNDHVFKADPLVALHQHLQSTQPVLEKPPRKKETKKKGQKKKKKAKSLIGSQTMEE